MSGEIFGLSRHDPSSSKPIRIRMTGEEKRCAVDMEAERRVITTGLYAYDTDNRAVSYRSIPCYRYPRQQGEHH